MAAITFPTNPTFGQVSGKWSWNGSAWTTGPGPWVDIPLLPAYTVGANGAKCRLRGDMVDLRFSVIKAGAQKVFGTLPLGYRPRWRQGFALVVSGVANPGYYVNPNGELQWVTAADVPNGTVITSHGVTFYLT